MNHRPSHHRIAILATTGFEESELFQPLSTFRDAGCDVKIVSLKSGEIRSWSKDNWGKSVDVDMTVAQCHTDDFDALVLPGGLINPDILRTDAAAVQLISAFAKEEKIIAAICHAPWLLIEADLVEDREVTSYTSVRTDLVNAGAHWRDESVVTDDFIITSRNPQDIPAFCRQILQELNRRSQSSSSSEPSLKNNRKDNSSLRF